MVRKHIVYGKIEMKNVYRPDGFDPELTEKLNNTNLKIGDLLSETAAINAYPD